ncbi:CC_3452 family protein [Sphingomicrobium astaxanthinifaciens]|uniref:CC_3452 family protein n=1 Tax=Sphingomicrobium astaxanthinifaciens TaxID=1227949 RepID=UPI001FCC626A|nr:hypothetical protein [Sphingomicrobium astaxanthinifaciens]MCJ7421346.1 hypothetical protein [Sphingomicrobium astaxanthinifaciens]
MRALLPALAAAALAAPAVAAAPLLTAEAVAEVEPRVLVEGAAFQCAGTTCKTRSAASRPLVLCERLAKEVGPLTRFAVDGRALDAASLERCNAKAR